MKNVCYEVLTHLAKNGNQPVFDDGYNTVSSNTFKNVIENVILRMKKVGVCSSSCVGIYSEDVIVGTALSLAAAYIGCSWTKISTTSLKHCRLTHCIYHSDQEIIQGGANVHKVDDSWFIKNEPFELDEPDTDPENIWLYAESSGTTGEPKLIPITHSEFNKRVFARDPKEFLSFAKFSTSLYYALKSTVQYRTPISILNNVVIDISQTLKDNLILAGSIKQIKIYLQDKPVPKKPFKSIVSAGGSAISKDDCALLLKYFKIVRTTYSATEISRICQKEMTRIEQYNGSVGKPVTGCVIKFPSKHSSRFRIFSDLIDSKMGVFTNDIGYMKRGELYITGRVDEILNIEGIKINPVKVDQFIESVDGIEQCMCFDNDGVFAALIVGDQNIDITTPCTKSMGVSFTPKQFYFVDSLPYNQNGKLLRREAKSYIKA
jgi:acyl-coenzyme A synthetase/AMP-(fatty) acid ligase